MGILSKLLGFDRTIRSLTETHKKELDAVEDSYLEEVASLKESLKSELASEVADWTAEGQTERELTPIDRQTLLSHSWNSFCKSPVCRSPVKYTTIFVFGKGITYEIDNEEAKAYVDAFYKRHRLDQLQKQLSNELQIYGELFLYTPESEMVTNTELSEGKKIIREAANKKTTEHAKVPDLIPIDPAEIEDIETDEFDIRKVIRYKRVYMTAKGNQVTDYIPASEIQHITVNNASNSKRGRSDLESIILWARRYTDFLKNRVLINQAKRAIFFDVTVDGTPGEVRAEQAKYKKLPKFGSILVHNTKVKWAVVNPKIESREAESDGRMLLRMVAIGVLLPEYFLSEAKGTTYAASKVQEVPALRKYLDYQDVWEAEFIDLFKHIIALGIKYGPLPEKHIVTVDEEEVEKDLVDVPIRIHFPELKEKNILDAAKAMALLLDVGVSKKTVFDVGGFDWETERKLKAEETEEEETEEFNKGRYP